MASILSLLFVLTGVRAASDPVNLVDEIQTALGKRDDANRVIDYLRMSAKDLENDLPVFDDKGQSKNVELISVVALFSLLLFYLKESKLVTPFLPPGPVRSSLKCLKILAILSSLTLNSARKCFCATLSATKFPRKSSKS